MSKKDVIISYRKFIPDFTDILDLLFKLKKEIGVYMNLRGPPVFETPGDIRETLESFWSKHQFWPWRITMNNSNCLLMRVPAALVQCWSKEESFKCHQRNYPITERKSLACVSALEKFRTFFTEKPVCTRSYNNIASNNGEIIVIMYVSLDTKGKIIHKTWKFKCSRD